MSHPRDRRLEQAAPPLASLAIASPPHPLRRLALRFAPLPAPLPGDWLDLHDEPGQAPATFRKKFKLRRYLPGDPPPPLMVHPLDNFPRPLAALAASVIALTTGLPARLARRLSTAAIPAHARLGPQLSCRYIEEHLLVELEDEGQFGRMALCQRDLFHEDPELPGSILGEAQPALRTAVISSAMVGPYPGEPLRLAAERLLKCCTHEVAHLLGMHHCLAFACNMNGTANLEEIDAQPAALCPECLAKLAHALPQRPIASWPDRMHRLAALWAKLGCLEHAAVHAAIADDLRRELAR